MPFILITNFIYQSTNFTVENIMTCYFLICRFTRYHVVEKKSTGTKTLSGSAINDNLGILDLPEVVNVWLEVGYSEERKV